MFVVDITNTMAANKDRKIRTTPKIYIKHYNSPDIGKETDI